MEVLYVHNEAVHNFSAANEMLPFIIETFNPSSILDVGCGIGTWLKVAKDLGVKEVIGVDGAYTNKALLKINTDEFVEKDIRQSFSLERKFDIVFCFEVVEHLPESSAGIIVETLIKHSDVILFSAAIPGQGGQNHINEQWPGYWAENFLKHDYYFCDLLREKFWLNDKIEWWYRQNTFVVIKKGHFLSKHLTTSPLPLVHPELFNTILEIKEKEISNLNAALDKNKKKSFVKYFRRKIIGVLKPLLKGM